MVNKWGLHFHFSVNDPFKTIEQRFVCLFIRILQVECSGNPIFDPIYIVFKITVFIYIYIIFSLLLN